MGSESALFGTDGIRGRFGAEPITPSFAYHLGSVLASNMLADHALVCVGRDTRDSSITLANSLNQGLRAGGAAIEDLGVMPTPGIAYSAKHGQSSLGIAITASHNPYEYNGFKLFDADGGKLDTTAEQHLDGLLQATQKTTIDDDAVNCQLSNEASSGYLEYLLASAENLGRTQLTGIVDCAHGATTATAAAVFDRVLGETTYIGNEPNGFNINLGVGSTSLDSVRKEVFERQANIGIAFDGDGDRILFIDDAGAVVDGDQILYLLANHWLDSRMGEGVVGTDMSNHGLALALESIGIEFVRTDVGDRHIANELSKRGWRLGGEPSGHVIWHDVSHTGDGVLIALCVLDVMHRTGSTLRELVDPLQMLPQQLRNVTTTDPRVLIEKEEVKAILADCDDRIGTEGRLLVRASGTEPVVRVMVEHVDADAAEELVDAVAQAIEAVN